MIRLSRYLFLLLLASVAVPADAFPLHMLAGRPKQAAAGGGAYTPNTVDFSGVAGEMWLERDAQLFSTDSDQIYFSAWIKPGAAETAKILYIDSTDGVNIGLNSSDLLYIDCDSTVNTTVIQLRSTATIDRTGNVWTHVFIRIDRTTDNQGEIYVNGTAGTTITTFLSRGEHDNPIDTAAADSAVAANVTAGTQQYDGCMADVWMSIGNTYANITVGDFISGGDPVDLGATGTGPDGSQPALFLKGNGTGFTVNSGSGGDMVKKGTTALATCSNTP